ncbi:MAG TPA: hypothetical protein PKA82_06975 [Pyrinomonadaceae bacterium]|nr:hypothetical protein [Pyrinomonadaceae bacterium]
MRYDHLDSDFDENEFPLGYLITFRTYGTWLHGTNANRSLVAD